MNEALTLPSIYKSPDGQAAIMHWYNRQLSWLSTPVESRWVDTSAGPTHLLVAGPSSAPPLFLLHGMNLNAAAMMAAIERLSSLRRVYALDLIGMPGKSAGTRPSRTGDGYPRWLSEVMTSLGVSRAEFLGQSFGGWIILKLAADMPDRISKAVLLGSGGLVPFTLSGQASVGFATLRYMLWPTETNLQRAVQPFYGPGVSPNPHLKALLGRSYRHVRMDVDWRGLPVPDRNRLSCLRAPVFVSYGAHDRFFTPQRAIQNAQKAWGPRAKTELVETEGHLFSESGEQERYDRVAAFLAA